MPGYYSSQGTTVTFDGVSIGYLTGFDSEGGAGQLAEKTNVSSPVVGSGANARVVKQYDCTSVEPLTLSITFWGPPSFSQSDGGKRATLTFSAPGGSISGTAILQRFSWSGRANQWSNGSATFQITGE